MSKKSKNTIRNSSLQNNDEKKRINGKQFDIILAASILEKEVRTEKEVLREVVREKIAATPPTDVLSFPSVPASSGASATEPPSYLSDELRPKIQEFAKVALEKSLGDAISLAKATKNAALIDAFHDYIVDELYEKLVAEAKLREVK